MDAIFFIGQTVAMVILIILIGTRVCLVLTSLASAMVLLFCLVYRVDLGSGQTDQKFDPVYNALDATIQVATRAWGRIVASGPWICGLSLLTDVLTIVIELVFAKMGRYSLSMWMGSIVTPIPGFLFMGHLGILLVMTACDMTTEEA